LYNNYYGYYNPTTNSGYQPFDHYTRLGAILFDANGQLTSLPFAVQQTRLPPYQDSSGSAITVVNQLGRRLGLTAAGQNPNYTTGTGDLASDIPSPVSAAPPDPPN